ncbi:DoxX family membrane protein [Candidatus Woesearchaeota archaeon]|nr:MAG: DoxX family membrane protein [Candidatus Woesearchaeota archaeon]
MELLLFVPALRIVLGLLLIVTGILKIPNLRGFSVIVASYGLLPRVLVRPLAYAQPFVEFVIGAWVLSGKQLFWGALAGLGLMLIANVFVLYALVQKKKMDNCGCYGVAVRVPLTWKKFGENVVWTLLFALLAFASY